MGWAGPKILWRAELGMKRYTFEQFAAVRRHVGLTFSPDGQQVAYTNNVSGQFNVWRQAVRPCGDDQPTMPVELTALVDDVARTVAWSPDGASILTTIDHHANENFQIYRIPAQSGWAYPVTNLPDARHEVPEQPFSPDGRSILYGSNARNPADFDVLIRDLQSDTERSVMAGDANYFPASWSPSGGHVLAVQIHSNTNFDLFLCDLESGQNMHLTPHDAEVVYAPGPWAPDGQSFYVLSNEGREFSALAQFDLDSRRLSWLETPDWDVQEVDLSSDGRFLAWIENQDGYSSLQVRDLQTGSTRAHSDLPEGVYSTLHFSPTQALLGFYISRPVGPEELYMLDVQSGEHWKLTRAFLGGIPESEMVEPELVRFRTFDGKQIPAFLYKPGEAAPDHEAPVVLSIHGGPEAQELPQYNYYGLYQYLLNRGIGVLAPNIRGSTGYGSSFQKLIHRDFGGDELKDLECAALYLRQLDWVDADRLGVFGGSFGGFATLSCLSRLPQYWAVGVDIVGPSNLITFTRSVPEFWKRLMREWVGDPDEDAEMLRERSPLTYVDNIRAPLLVIQGANDPRVVKAESDQMVERLRRQGREVEYMVFDDEGHGFTKISNALKGWRATAEWLERHLIPAA